MIAIHCYLASGKRAAIDLTKRASAFDTSNLGGFSSLLYRW
jgi:hypothetical protein